MHDSILLRVAVIAFALFLLIYLWVRISAKISGRRRLWAGMAYSLFLISSIAYRFVPLGLGPEGVLLFAWSGFCIVLLSHWLLATVGLDVISFFVWLQALMFGAGGRKRDLWRNIARRRDEWIPLTFGLVLVWTLISGYVGWKAQLDFRVHDIVHGVDKPMDKPLHIAVISDIHMDPLFQVSKWQRLLDTLEARKPDLILILGDISDLSIHDMKKLQFDRDLHHLHAPLGVFSITGNHEAYQLRKESESLRWVSQQGIQWLRDETICLAPLCITGREDFAVAEYHDRYRLALPALAPDRITAASRPWLVLDHQPRALYDFDLNGLSSLPDLGLSGHTHAGQFIPWIWVIQLTGPITSGEGLLSGIPWIVSSGFGQWGPALREGCQTELIMLTLYGRHK